MFFYASEKDRQDLYEAHREYLRSIPWEWHATLTFPQKANGAEVDFFEGLRRFRKWRLKIVDKEKLRVGVSLMSSYKRGRVHFHCLMIGASRRGKTLKKCKRWEWESRWFGHARIKKVEANPQEIDPETKDVEVNEKVSDYVAKHLLGFKSDYAQVEAFDTKLLERAMRYTPNGGVFWHTL